MGRFFAVNEAHFALLLRPLILTISTAAQRHWRHQLCGTCRPPPGAYAVTLIWQFYGFSDYYIFVEIYVYSVIFRRISSTCKPCPNWLKIPVTSLLSDTDLFVKLIIIIIWLIGSWPGVTAFRKEAETVAGSGCPGVRACAVRSSTASSVPGRLRRVPCLVH